MFTNSGVWLIGALGILIGLAAGYYLRQRFALRLKDSTERKAQKELEEAREKVKTIVLEAQDKAASILVDIQKEEKERKQELRRLEERLLKKEDLLESERRDLAGESERNKAELEKLTSLETEARAAQERAVKELEKVAGLSKEEAKARLYKELEEESREDLGRKLAFLEREERDKIEKKSVEIITSAIQRYARSSVSDVTTSVVNLPDEEIKGKIIGREGRNIRAFERLTGVEVIIDETPESLLLSSFDPMRRELAKIALEKLIKDGRIQPAKIEEKVEEAREELDARVRKIGEEAAYEVGILDLPKEIIQLLGRLNYRTSYGQNVLTHSVEVAHIAGMMAGELGLNVDVAKRGALVHDIGKAIDHEVEGTHVELGRKLLKKYNIAESVIQAMEAHHDEYPFATPESYVVAAADAISAARPGARRDTLEKYLRRLEEIEKVVNGFEGVKQSYAVAAGREVRVFVTPEKIDDFGALRLAKDIAAKIQSEVQYPGEIKVTVIREVKAVEYAR
ncbi:MAG: Ribonuclease Y [Candidatus Jorgensenbacteria bacterium GW2011_GWA1_48_11]|uniref:Ribonuclease Y n=1 Tax=Candidatus Jorgensenbacteria bacterium GW2011_GWA1_48_11 TaxID=1618660 RepID=A0A0G1UBM9_9BACT|nr:MAG: Ribonuclease Y [Candidatus Jorgensenbacteria bacterium GW2011_GWA1_48_11]KKW12017.1 MAG: Ribonuclease Y [Candidatus Jorgensenbacteria bacterium GW2011_GWB1_49_9]